MLSDKVSCIWAGLVYAAHTCREKCIRTCSPNHMCCYQTLWTSLSVSASPMRYFCGTAWLIFFGALAGLCHFLGIATSYVIGKTCKAIKKQAKHKSQVHSPPHSFITLREHAKERSMSALRSQGLAYHRCLRLKCTTSRCRCRPGWAWASASQRRRAEKNQGQRIHQLECPCHR